MNPTTLTIIFGIIGAFGVLFGIYKHFSTLRVAKVIFDFKEMADFDLPKEFFLNIPSMPISFEIENTGNKKAENLIFTSEFNSKIIDSRIETSEEYTISIEDNKIIIKADKLNPSEQIKIFLTCQRIDNPNNSIIKKQNLTISEGNVYSKDNIIKQEKFLEAVIMSMPFGLGRIYEIASKK